MEQALYWTLSIFIMSSLVSPASQTTAAYSKTLLACLRKTSISVCLLAPIFFSLLRTQSLEYAFLVICVVLACHLRSSEIISPRFSFLSPLQFLLHLYSTQVENRRSCRVEEHQFCFILVDFHFIFNSIFF